MALALAATVLWSYQVRRADHAQTRANQHAQADTMLDAVESKIHEGGNVVLAVASLFQTRAVDRQEFEVFTAPFLKRSTELQALGWIPKVVREERAHYENLAKASFPDFSFTERNAQGRLVPRVERDHYYPVFYLEPLSGNETALGFDLASDPIRAAAIDEITTSRALAVTGRVNLVQESKGQAGFLVFAPVIGRDARNPEVHAFVSGVFQLPALVALAIGPPPSREYLLRIEDLGGTTQDRLLHDEPADCSRDEVLLRGINVAQRQWQLSISRCASAAGGFNRFAPWVLFLGGGFSLMLGALVFSIVNRTQEIEQTVRERTKELRRSNRDLQQFAYVASHDLRSPLRAIDSLSHWIADDLEPHLTDETRGHVALLQARIKRMEALLDALLDYAMVGRAKLAVTQVDLNELVEEVAAVAATGTDFVIKTSGALPVLATSRVALEQVLANLIGNAIKHHHRNGGCIEVAVADEGRFLRFSIADDGPGIEAEYRERAFEMFQTLRSRDEVEGSGMGLALVRRRVEAFGGEIDCHPRPGGGTIFVFTWPKTLPMSRHT